MPAFKKPLFLVLGLLVFAVLGTGVVFVSGLKSRPKPVLSSGYQFSKGISPAKLEFSNGEIVTLNRVFWEKRDILKKTVLTVVGQESERGPKKMTAQSGLKFSIELKSKNGMSYSPENVQCKRGRLVSEISRYMDEGAKVLAAYAKDPALLNREVEIVDM
ncbi:hypothetical protein [Maridesulfovibrio sp.]|uniref:hypothetical protein n=1 Tax=Maridesulfovibrio sp. TaxID=2795000 RepID=UPI0039F0FBA2